MLVPRWLSPSDDKGGEQAANRSTRQKDAFRQKPQRDRGFEAQAEETPDERKSYYATLCHSSGCHVLQSAYMCIRLLGKQILSGFLKFGDVGERSFWRLMVSFYFWSSPVRTCGRLSEQPLFLMLESSVSLTESKPAGAEK